MLVMMRPGRGCGRTLLSFTTNGSGADLHVQAGVRVRPAGRCVVRRGSGWFVGRCGEGGSHWWLQGPSGKGLESLLLFLSKALLLDAEDPGESSDDEDEPLLLEQGASGP